MFRMIGDFKFDLEEDLYKRKDGLKMLLKEEKQNLYSACFFYTSDNQFNLLIYADDWDDFHDKLEYKLKTEEIDLPKLPIPTKEKIKELMNKSNEAEVNFLEKRVSKLEDRVQILEDSVEDLENWRHN